MNAFMVVATFKPGTSMEEVLTVVAEEQAKWWDLNIFPLNEAASPKVAS